MVKKTSKCGFFEDECCGPKDQGRNGEELGYRDAPHLETPRKTREPPHVLDRRTGGQMYYVRIDRRTDTWTSSIIRGQSWRETKPWNVFCCPSRALLGSHSFSFLTRRGLYRLICPSVRQTIRPSVRLSIRLFLRPSVRSSTPPHVLGPVTYDCHTWFRKNERKVRTIPRSIIALF